MALFRKLFLGFCLVSFLGCDGFYKEMGSTEYGIKFRMLPSFLGGGISSNVIQKGQTVFLFPWDKLYIFDTKVQSIEWGDDKDKDAKSAEKSYVKTRALDGNEVSLAVRIEYQISGTEKELINLANKIATTNQGVDKIVRNIAKADIRTYMNELNTDQFFDNKAKYDGQDKVWIAMQKRLSQYGIEILSVNLKEHRFERTLLDGTIDKAYQEKINEVQTTDEKTRKEERRIKAILAQKESEYAVSMAQRNKIIQEALGYEAQAKSRGDSYFLAKENEAKKILVNGKLEAEGLDEQVKALSGKGGENVVKLKIGKELSASPSTFITIGDENKNSVSVEKVDTNELVKMLGVLEGVKEKKGK
ncbi:MAG: SPFH domain-containing protein [Bdellovibrionota bacterium]